MKSGTPGAIPAATLGATPLRRVGIILGLVTVALIAVAATVFTIQRASNYETSDHETSDQQDDQHAAEATAEPTPTDLPQAPSPDGETSEPDMSAEDRQALEVVAVEAATIMTTWDPNEDFNQTEAELRAADLITEERADQIVAPERPATGTEWLEAAEAGATSEPSVDVNEGTESDVVSVVATWVWTDSDGHVVSNPDERRVFYFDFEEVDGELLVSDYQWESL